MFFCSVPFSPSSCFSFHFHFVPVCIGYQVVKDLGDWSFYIPNTHYSTLVTNFFVSLILMELNPRDSLVSRMIKTRNYGDCLIVSGSWFPDELTCNTKYITIKIIINADNWKVIITSLKPASWPHLSAIRPTPGEPVKQQKWHKITCPVQK